MGSNISIAKLLAGFWNSEAIEARYNSQAQVSSQKGGLRFISSQSIQLRGAKLSLPSCHLDATLDFESPPQSRTAFDFELGDSMLVLHQGRFVSAALARSTPTRLDCTSFHTALASYKTGPITADISPSDIKFKSSVVDASGSFLARIGQIALPVIGRGRLSTVSIEGPSLRKPESASIDQLSVAGLQYSSAAIPSVGNFRRVANEIGSALALPDFLSPEQQQLKAIDDTSAAVAQLSSAGADVLAHIPATEVKFLTDKKLKELGIQKIISFGFGKQEILAFIPASGTNSPISLVLHLAISTGNTYLSIRPSVSFAALSSLSSTQMGVGKRTPEQIAVFLEKQLAPITKPLTTFDTQIKVPIPTNNVCNLDLTKPIIDEKTKAVIDVKAASTTIAVSVPQKAILIDPDGLHVMVHVDVDLKRTDNNAPTC